MLAVCLESKNAKDCRGNRRVVVCRLIVQASIITQLINTPQGKRPSYAVALQLTLNHVSFVTSHMPVPMLVRSPAVQHGRLS